MNKNYVIYYEMPPMRAIMHRPVVAESEAEAVGKLKAQIQMPIKIRKVEEQ
ncbi:hypothetical protein [Bacillus sp. M6-12]|uniref:hypothetical protein n=1 Tax=Bacillus sp. M6-12 TaxID=2054166 RepID=UPI001C60C801|nr:hypothetical protein [Bacillus sp. M6-12]